MKTLTRFNPWRGRLLVAGGALALGAALTACGSSATGLATSCSSYVKLSADKQLHIASQWGYPMRNGKTDSLSDAVAPDYRDRLISYCEQPGHGGQKIQDLELTLGP